MDLVGGQGASAAETAAAAGGFDRELGRALGREGPASAPAEAGRARDGVSRESGGADPTPEAGEPARPRARTADPEVKAGEGADGRAQTEDTADAAEAARAGAGLAPPAPAPEPGAPTLLALRGAGIALEAETGRPAALPADARPPGARDEAAPSHAAEQPAERLRAPLAAGTPPERLESRAAATAPPETRGAPGSPEPPAARSTVAAALPNPPEARPGAPVADRATATARPGTNPPAGGDPSGTAAPAPDVRADRLPSRAEGLRQGGAEPAGPLSRPHGAPGPAASRAAPAHHDPSGGGRHPGEGESGGRGASPEPGSARPADAALGARPEPVASGAAPPTAATGGEGVDGRDAVLAPHGVTGAAAATPSTAAGSTGPSAASPPEALPLHVEWLAARGGGRARIRLHPPELGAVDLLVRVRGSAVQIVVSAHEAATRAVVSAGREGLVDALAARDLRVDHFEVSDPSPGGDAGHGEFREHREGGQAGEGHAGREAAPAPRLGAAAGSGPAREEPVPPWQRSTGQSAGVDLRV